jgi:hypothetical protein
MNAPFADELEQARLAVFTPSPLDILGTIRKPTINPVTGAWEFVDFHRFTDAKGARADQLASAAGRAFDEEHK